jgi:hypothetical protein
VIELNSKLDGLIRDGYEILYLDEAIFSFNTFNGRVWSHPKTNFEVLEHQTAIKTQALLAAISL